MKKIASILAGLIALANSCTAQAQEINGEFVVMSCIAIDSNTLMDKETGILYNNPVDLEVGELYRVPAFNAENPADYEVIDLDTWVDYLWGITEYEHDLTRVEVCKALDKNSLIQNDGEVFCIEGNLVEGNLYYTFFDKVNTDENIYDDRVIEVLPIDVFDLEIYELNKMCMEEN